jgi:hypothetical protein
MAEARAVLREMDDPPQILNVVASAETISFTSDDGTVRKFAIDDKKEKVDLGTATVDATTRWDSGKLSQEIDIGGLKITRTFQVTDEGNQMIVTVSTQGGGGGGRGGQGANARGGQGAGGSSGSGGSGANGGGGMGGSAPLKAIYDKNSGS